MFQDNDQRFKKYVKHTSMSSSLQDAVAQAKGFVEACCDPIASEIDKACLGIGGHIHIAEVTPSGFRWLIPPASLLAAEQKKGRDS